MRLIKLFVILFVVIAVGGGVAYYWQNSEKAQTSHTSEVNQSVESPSQPDLKITKDDVKEGRQKPPSQSSLGTENSLPGIDDSDITIQEGLGRLFGKNIFNSLFYANDIIRRTVVTIENLKEHKQSAPEFLPIKSPEGSFLIVSNAKDQIISPANNLRYSRYVMLAKSIDSEKLVAIYKRFYPLFQKAYSELGTNMSFNHRLVEVIDHLIKTPDVTGPIKVFMPGVYFYKFIDPKLESLSSGQKALLRFGQENAKIIKSKLSEIRSLLTTR